MRLRIIAAALALSSSPALAAEPEPKPKLQERPTEPVLCFVLVGSLGYEITVGQSIDLCAATRDAVQTAKCFTQAFRHPEDGGLGLNRGQAVDLCKTIPRAGM